MVVALHAVTHQRKILRDRGICQGPVGQNLVASFRQEVEVEAATNDRETGTVSLIYYQRFSLELNNWSCIVWREEERLGQRQLSTDGHMQ